MKCRYTKPTIHTIHIDTCILAASGKGDSSINAGDDITQESGTVWGDSKRHDFDITDFVPFQYDNEE